jgi:hypothetical protein
MGRILILPSTSLDIAASGASGTEGKEKGRILILPSGSVAVAVAALSSETPGVLDALVNDIGVCGLPANLEILKGLPVDRVVAFRPSCLVLVLVFVIFECPGVLSGTAVPLVDVVGNGADCLVLVLVLVRICVTLPLFALGLAGYTVV